MPRSVIQVRFLRSKEGGDEVKGNALEVARGIDSCAGEIIHIFYIENFSLARVKRVLGGDASGLSETKRKLRKWSWICKKK